MSNKELAVEAMSAVERMARYSTIPHGVAMELIARIGAALARLELLPDPVEE